ncbi:unnamed protein product [Orchesella dallaii]|uniref:Ras-associating domain-containing protein n=1 Tax=Orchesella dallaii TaxID=48710 RepID=A0ABP1S2P6_9HEXA
MNCTNLSPIILKSRSKTTVRFQKVSSNHTTKSISCNKSGSSSSRCSGSSDTTSNKSSTSTSSAGSSSSSSSSSSSGGALHGAIRKLSAAATNTLSLHNNHQNHDSTLSNKRSDEHQGLVEAVEQGDVIKADRILTTNDVDINSATGDGLTLLEMAVIQGNQPLLRLLQTHGATENQYRAKPVSDQLSGMVQEAEKTSELLMTRILKCSTFGNLSTAELKELEKEFNMWEKRYKRLKKMKSSYSQIRPPEAKLLVSVDVIGSSGVRIKICEDSASKEKVIFTKYRIEWSPSDKFSRENTSGIEIFDLKKLETVVNFLKSGCRYFFRIAFGNFQGYGRFQNCTPFSVVPSSWRDVHGAKPRYTGKEPIFDDILTHLKSTLSDSSCSEHVTSRDVSNAGTVGHHNHQAKKAQKKLSIKTLFSTPKFQKSFTRGFFLSCVVYCENKILVTLDDVLPVLEIDENFPGAVQKDFHWLLKVACNWEDVKYLKQEMEKPANASTFHTRLKMLNAIISMQNTLGMEDLGRLYYKTLRDDSNSVVFISTINYLRTTKVVSALNVRWTPLFKLTNRKVLDPACDMLMSTIKEQILYHQVSNIPLGKGLYLGYLKLASSVDLLKIIVPTKSPNMLPHVKVRDNPHVSSEEWFALQNLVKSKSLDLLSCESSNTTSSDNGTKSKTASDSESEGSDTARYSEAQDIFRKEVSSSFKKLLTLLEVDENSSIGHRIYNTEVIEVSSAVSLLVVLPSVENVCLVAGQSDKLLHRNDLIALPIQVFEVVHLCTYQNEFVSRYARLSTMLEVATILAHHNQREAFSSDELTSAKHRTILFSDLQAKTDMNWKSSRWVMDLVTLARAKDPGVLPVQQAFAQTVGKASSDSIASIMSADATLVSNDKPLGEDFAPRPSPHLKIGTNLKCSRSENILATLGQQGVKDQIDSFLNPPEYHSSQPDSLASPHKFTSASPKEKPSTQATNKAAFASGRLSYTSHSQSETSISVLATQCGSPCTGASPFYSPSLHNLCKHASDSEGSLQAAAETSDEVPQTDQQQDNVSQLSTNLGDRLSVTSNVASVESSSPLPSSSPIPLDLITSQGLINNHQRQSSSSSSVISEASDTNLPLISSMTASKAGIVRPIAESVKQTKVVAVYAAYSCGLAPGTCVRLQITNHTTSRQILNLLIKHLSAAVLAKGLDGPIYDNYQDFCLVAVIGARERVLRLDFKPMQLQKPWDLARLYVRKKLDVTAAIMAESRILSMCTGLPTAQPDYVPEEPE